MKNTEAPAKYPHPLFNKGVNLTLKNICREISKRYEIGFIETGIDKKHAHFLIQSVPNYSATKIVTVMENITARALFSKHFVNTANKFDHERHREERRDIT